MVAWNLEISYSLIWMLKYRTFCWSNVYNIPIDKFSPLGHHQGHGFVGIVEILVNIQAKYSAADLSWIWQRCPVFSYAWFVDFCRLSSVLHPGFKQIILITLTIFVIRCNQSLHWLKTWPSERSLDIVTKTGIGSILAGYTLGNWLWGADFFQIGSGNILHRQSIDDFIGFQAKAMCES